MPAQHLRNYKDLKHGTVGSSPDLNLQGLNGMRFVVAAHPPVKTMKIGPWYNSDNISERDGDSAVLERHCHSGRCMKSAISCLRAYLTGTRMEVPKRWRREIHFGFGLVLSAMEGLD